MKKTDYNSNLPDFIIDYLKSPGTFSESEKFHKWIEENGENKEIFDECLDIWQASHISDSANVYDSGLAWQEMKKTLKLPVRNEQKINWHVVLSVAAASLLLIISTFYFYQKYSLAKQSDVTTEYVVPYGSKSHVILPDGSKIWLNAGTKLTYGGLFGIKERTVVLNGEAFFDVKPSKFPFIVNTSEIEIKVVGTLFNVKAYSEEKKIETTVTKGKVEVFQKSANKKVQLTQNQQATLYVGKNADQVSEKKSNKKSHLIETKNDKNEPVVLKVDNNITPELFTSWKDNKWMIERESLENLATMLERKYNVNIVFKDDALKNYIFSGVLKDETLSQVLEAIKLTAPISYSLDEKTVVFSENKHMRSVFSPK